MKGYRQIERIIWSLRMRTDLTVSLKGETVSFTRLNSPCVGRQTVSVTQGHGIERLVIFGNGELFVAPQVKEAFDGDVITRDVPSFWFHGNRERNLFMFPLSIPAWLRDASIVTVAYPDRFSGYEKDGTPIFNKPARVWFRGINILKDQTTDQTWRLAAKADKGWFVIHPNDVLHGCEFDNKVHEELNSLGLQLQGCETERPICDKRGHGDEACGLCSYLWKWKVTRQTV